VVNKCVAHKDEYILKEGNKLQEYTNMHKKAFAKLCQSDTSSCGQLTHTCTVDTKSTDLFTVYAYWVANNMTDELGRHKDLRLL
jgi:L-rhamnose mutarotase